MIGVIGGAGVAATNKFCELLENDLTKKERAFRDFHHPEMVIYQATKSPSRSMFLEGKGDSFIPSYIEVAKKLENIGAKYICMTCNTAHFAIDEIEKHINIPFLNMVKETAKEVNGFKNIGLIASNGALIGKVYEKYIEKNINIIYPNTKMQKLVTQGIINIKNSHRFDPLDSPMRPKNIFKKVSEYLYQKGADVILVGCTDIRVDFSQVDYSKLKLIDSLEILVKMVKKVK